MASYFGDWKVLLYKFFFVAALSLTLSSPAASAVYRLEIQSTVWSMSESEYYGSNASPSQVFRNPDSSLRAFGQEIAKGDPFDIEILFSDEPTNSQRLSWAPSHVIHRGAFVLQTIRIGDFVLPSAAVLMPFTDGISVVNDRPNSSNNVLTDDFLIGADFTYDGWEIDSSFQWIDNSGSSFTDNSIPTESSPIFDRYNHAIFRVYFSEPISNLSNQEFIQTLSVVAFTDRDSFRISRVDQPAPVPIPASGLMLGIAIILMGAANLRRQA